MHASRLRPARHRQHRREVAVAVRRVDPVAQADPVGAVVGEDLLGEPGLPVVGVLGVDLGLLHGEGQIVADDRGAGVAHRADLADARALHGDAHAAGDRAAGQPRGRANRHGRADGPPEVRLERHLRGGGGAGERDAVAVEHAPAPQVDGERARRAGGAPRRRRVAVCGGRCIGRGRCPAERQVDGRIVPASVRAGRGSERGEPEQGERQATRSHRPPPRARRSRRTRWMRWGRDSSSSA